MLQNPWSKIWAGYPHHSAPPIFSLPAPPLRSTDFSMKTASSLRSIKKSANFESWQGTPLKLLFKKSNLDFNFEIFIHHPLFLSLPLEDLRSSDFYFLDITCGIFSETGLSVKLEFPWDLNFRESRKVQFHGNSSPRKLQFHGNVARTKSSPRSFN